MTKCDNCHKSLTKKVPGLECSKCGKIVHASQACAGLAAKQISALRNSESLEWTCEECKQCSPVRKSSFIIPDEDEEEEDMVVNGNATTCTFDTNKFLKEITGEMKRVLKRELQNVEVSVNACTNKVEELKKTVVAQNTQIKELQNGYTQVKNENTHLTLKVKALEQIVGEMDQQRLESTLEVTGIPKGSNEDIQEIGVKISQHLNMDLNTIKRIKRTEGRNGQDGRVQMELVDSLAAVEWVRASKIKPVLLEHIMTVGSESSSNKSPVFIRRALTKNNKALLWQAQQQLRPTYKYVWCQDGKILARLNDNEKPKVIRCTDDIQNISNRNLVQDAQR